MTFEETKKFLNENMEEIKKIVPSYGDVDSALNILFEKVEYAMNNDDISHIKNSEIYKVKQFFNFYIKGLILLDFKMTDSAKKVSETLSLLIENFSNIYSQEDEYDPTGLVIRTLVSSKASLESQIIVNTYLVGRLQDILSFKQEPLDILLSNKYYEEYINFLNRRKDHDASYSLNEVCKN